MSKRADKKRNPLWVDLSEKSVPVSHRHLPEPWQVRWYEADTVLVDGTGVSVLYAVGPYDMPACDPADALRIAACVNALAGIDDPVAFVAAARAAGVCGSV